MLEPLIIAILALNGIVCTAILAFALVRSGWLRDRRWPEEPDRPAAPPLDFLAQERYAPEAIFSIMREFFPAEYERYRRGTLDAREQRWVWDSCCAIHDARAEIEEICG